MNKIETALKNALEQFKYMLEQMGPELEKEPYIGAGSEISSRMDELHEALTAQSPPDGCVVWKGKTYAADEVCRDDDGKVVLLLSPKGPAHEQG